MRCMEHNDIVLIEFFFSLNIQLDENKTIEIFRCFLFGVLKVIIISSEIYENRECVIQ
jgi:hypothetical protein